MKKTNTRKPNGYWTKERCKEEALKYNTRSEFQKKSISAYVSAQRNGWVDDICSHMVRPKIHNFKWSYDACKEEALKYKSRKKFKKKSCGAYSSARKNGWLDDICSHMNKPLSGTYFIYGYFFSDNHCYIGLSKNIEYRQYQHIIDENSIVSIHQNETKLKPKIKILYKQEIFNDNEIKEKEYYYLNKYAELGWVKLNKHKTGALGAMKIKWTYDACKVEALNIIQGLNFIKIQVELIKYQLKNGWLDEFFPKKYAFKWSYEACKEEASKYNTRTEFSKNSSGAYKSAKRNGWLDEFFPKK